MQGAPRVPLAESQAINDSNKGGSGTFYFDSMRAQRSQTWINSVVKNV